jgi:chaperonin GroEL
VRRTLGPQGANALLPRSYNRGNRITNDGATIAGFIEPKDDFEALVAQPFREATKLTNEKVGDGTTTATVIAGVLDPDTFLIRSTTL